MKIAILSRNPKLYSTRRLVEATEGRSHEVRVVDVLRSAHGPVVMEVSSSPGLEGRDTSRGKDIAGTIIEFIEKNAAAAGTRPRGQG